MNLDAEDLELELIVPDGIFPLWSPDGGRFTFTAFRDENMELFVSDRNGKNLRNLTQPESTTALERGLRMGTGSRSRATVPAISTSGSSM